MAKLNGQQFRQPMLPGMGRMKRLTPTEAEVRSTVEDWHAGASYEVASAKAAARRNPPATPGHWSGPTIGQTVLEGQQLDADNVKTVGAHGFIQVPGTSHMHDIYMSWGGRHGTSIRETIQKQYGTTPSQMGFEPDEFEDAERRGRQVRRMWSQLPTQQVRSDTPIHTAQRPEETWGGPLHESPSNFDASRAFYQEGEIPGGRVGKIRESLRQGEPLKKPAWLIRTQSGSLLSVDAHHRMLAGRSEGLESFPAKVWDWSKQPPRRGGGNADTLSYWDRGD